MSMLKTKARRKRVMTDRERADLVRSLCGKYRYVRTSSAAFARRKREEIALEDRPR